MLKRLQDQSIMKNMTKVYQSGDDLWKIYGYEFEKSKSATTNTRGEGSLDILHVGNFFDAIRENKSLHSDIKDASVSTMLCHLGNIAHDVGETIKINSSTGRVLKNYKAMQNWKREYQPGWEPKL